MFSVQRYDAGGGGGAGGEGSSSNGLGGKPDRIALINQRKASLQRQNQQGQQEGAHLTASGISSAEAGSSRPFFAAGPVAQAATGNGVAPGGPAIHPSRLAVSQVLRQADKKAKIAAGGGNKEKTKAKQRYLKTKKERRKKRKAAESSKGKKKATTQTAIGAGPGGGRDGEDDEEESDEESEEDEGDDETRELEKGEGHTKTAPPAAKRQKLDKADEDGDQAMKEEDSSNTDSSNSVSSSASSSSSSSASEELPEKEDAYRSAAKEAMSASEDTTLVSKDVIAPQAESEEAALSRFPAPKRTLQASRKDLAAQGLPPGLANPQRVDPAMTKSVKKSDHAKLDQISAGIKNRLAKIGITEWFAVQTAVIPLLLSDPQAKSLYPNPPLADLCVSAPTGSGKTLSYAVPLVEVLSDTICRRLRALIILPTRELVNQVRDTLLQVSKGTSLSITAITGQQSFQQEQAALVEKVGAKAKARIPGMMVSEDPKEEDDEGGSDEFKSNVDILITTPGRLIDHLEHTAGFTMQHLRFLVIDEADRLLGQSFQEWLPRLLEALDPKKDATSMPGRGAVSPAWIRHGSSQALPKDLDKMSISEEPISIGVQKLLFSATLTRDPAKILALGLRNAAFISVEDEDAQKEQWGLEGEKGSFIDRQETFTLPATLKEHMIITKASDKPLDLLHLLHHPSHQLRQVLCFTKSVENAARLVKLINSFEETRKSEGEKGGEEGRAFVAREYSSDLNITQRGRILKGFKAKEIDLLVCSDVMARGMDLPDVRHVISYDVPVDMAKYVHRVGRTARATKEGDAWTLVEEQEARHFKTMIKRGGRKGHMEKVKIRTEDKRELQQGYEEALSKLEAMYTTIR